MMTQIDELVKRLRYNRSKFNADDRDALAAADALEAQAAREALLREDLQHMESLAEEYLASSNAQAARIATLEAQLKAFKAAAIEARDTVVTTTACMLKPRVFDALMLALRMEGEKL